MRCAELVALAATAGQAADVPGIVESWLESGLRVVATASPELEGGPVGVALVVPVGWADDSSLAGRGLARSLADFAVFAPAPDAAAFTVEVAPGFTCFRAELAREQVEAALSRLVRRLTATGIDEESFAEFSAARAAIEATSADRFRETAFPTTREGASPAGRADSVASITHESLAAFAADRFGSEGAVVAFAAGGGLAELELLAARAFEDFPRARRVAPPFVAEPFPARARSVPARAGEPGWVGLRLRWRDDPLGDGVAFACAALEAATGRPATLFETSGQGTLLGFEAATPAECDGLREALLSAAQGSRFAAALDRVDRALRDRISTPSGRAREIAVSAALHGDPGASYSRRGRLERGGAAEAEAGLRRLLAAEGLIEVRPGGEAGGTKVP